MQEAVKWAPDITRSHLQEYLSNNKHSLFGMSQHSGLALAVESVVLFAKLNSISSSLSTTTLEKWPSCVKNDCSEFITSMSLRSRFFGEVEGMLNINSQSNHQENYNHLSKQFVVQYKESIQKCDVVFHQETVYRITALIIATPSINRELIHVLCWAAVDFFSEETIESVISCWKWLLAARQDLELLVKRLCN